MIRRHPHVFGDAKGLSADEVQADLGADQIRRKISEAGRVGRQPARLRRAAFSRMFRWPCPV